MHNAPRFIFTIDHLTDDQLTFFGWVVVDEDDEFKMYRRMHDGDQQVVQKSPPRWFMVDDVNDAQQMSTGGIIVGPETYSSDH